MTSFNTNDKEKLERFINGNANEDEKAWIESLLMDGDDNIELRNTLETDWRNMLKSGSVTEVNLDQLLDRIHHRIRKNEMIKTQKPIRKMISIYMRVAAILLLPLLLAGGLLFKYMVRQNEVTPDQQVNSMIYAPMGARVSFNLPDGTKGMLNSGSILSYSLPFSNSRQVKLQGEAWLEVHHDEYHPFEINTGNSSVNVLGTSLNVSAYPEEKYVEVVLVEGSVEFVNKTNNEKEIMTPSKRLVFQDGNVHQSLTDPEKYNAWTEGKLVFRGDPMAEVARRIERWYNVKIILADPALEKYSFRGTFEDDKIEEVLRFLSMTSPIRYDITPRVVLTDGTFEKQLITIHKY
jgi:ferric-dicitrate binding protein FerR (iron transport regulator)